MAEQELWARKLVSDIYFAGFRIKEVAAEAKLNSKYVSQLLHGKCESKVAEAKLREALERLKQQKEKADG